jgi:hypothetical protein
VAYAAFITTADRTSVSGRRSEVEGAGAGSYCTSTADRSTREHDASSRDASRVRARDGASLACAPPSSSPRREAATTARARGCDRVRRVDSTRRPSGPARVVPTRQDILRREPCARVREVCGEITHGSSVGVLSPVKHPVAAFEVKFWQ